MKEKIDLSVNIAGIEMKNPIMPASGTFDAEEFMKIDGFHIRKLGALINKGTTLNERQGNKPPRIYETSSGIINFIGLQNPGVDVVIKEKLPRLHKLKMPVIVNVCGSTIEEYVEVVRRLNLSPTVTMEEINISCPNVKQGGCAFGQDPVLTKEVISAVRGETCLPLIAKLTPNVSNIVPIAEAAIKAGANAISLINTVKARGKFWSPADYGQYIEGGLSGPCIKPIALRFVSDLYKANLGVPIIGLGGICNVFDAIEFLESGALALQIGTANFVNPLVMMEIIRHLGIYIEKTGCKSLKEWRENKFPMPPEKEKIIFN